MNRQSKKRLFQSLSAPVFLILTLFLLAASCRPAAELSVDDRYPAELEKRETGSQAMVVTAHPLATETGKKILEMGGSAADAAIAAGFVLTVVEPMMSGLGGSGSATIWDAENGKPDYIDYYAQLGADPDFSLEADWEEDPDSVSRERIVAIPGTVAGFYELHQKYGTLSWAELLEPSIELARYGFTVHRLLAEVIRDYEARLTYDMEAAILFYPGGKPLQAGERLIQGALANLLEQIAASGPSAFYEGFAAERAIKKLQRGGSTLTEEDFAGYRPRWRGALAGSYNGLDIYSAPPPLAGTEVILGLNILEGFRLQDGGFPFEDQNSASVLADLFRVSMTDRWHWTGDPEFADVPAGGLISKAYAEKRRLKVGAAVPDSMAAGDPRNFNDRYEGPEGDGIFHTLNLPVEPPERSAGIRLQHFTSESVSTGRAGSAAARQKYSSTVRAAGDVQNDEQHTTHLSVVDSDGNAVSMTNTMGLYFGAAVFSDGVFYNSTNRNVATHYPNIRLPNRTAHSSTAPTIVVKDGEVRLVTGSPGSGRIPVNVISMIHYTFDHRLDPAVSVRMPRMFPERTSPQLHLEGGFTAKPIEFLRARGYEIVPRPVMDIYFGGVHMIYRAENGTLIGVADPRRDGQAAGY